MKFPGESDQMFCSDIVQKCQGILNSCQGKVRGNVWEFLNVLCEGTLNYCFLVWIPLASTCQFLVCTISHEPDFNQICMDTTLGHDTELIRFW